jgi:pimeloyl-ACP methyl ester carboxylesterase
MRDGAFHIVAPSLPGGALAERSLPCWVLRPALPLARIVQQFSRPGQNGSRQTRPAAPPTPPGYGFSSAPTKRGYGATAIARAVDALMAGLGYPRYVAQGGDWGAIVCRALAV